MRLRSPCLSVELVAGSERRPLFRDHWDMAMVSKGSPLRLEYTYDANQVFHLALKLADFPESVVFQASIENPLSHVVNPNKQQEEIDRLEEEYRQDTRKAEDLMPRIAELCADLGQHDKAIGVVRALLRQANRPVAWLLNRQAMYEDARGNQPAAIRGYEEAGKASSNWGGPLFNLALLHEKLRDYPVALRAIDRAIHAQDAPAYQALKLRIRKHLSADLDVTTQAKVVLASFGRTEALSDWELGWYIYAADIAHDRQARDAGIRARRALSATGAADTGGVRPDMRRIVE